MDEQRLTKKERKDLRHQEKQHNQQAPRSSNRSFGWAIALIVTVLAIGGFLMTSRASKQSTAKTGDIVSKSGIHWHPELAIYIKGQKQEIPTNIGIGKQYSSSKWYDPMMSMTDFHTHDTSGKLHWEVMDGPVTKDHVTLKAFFDVWGKQFSSTCIFDSCNGPNGTVKMAVNGQSNTEFENYQIHDKDKIEIRYE